MTERQWKMSRSKLTSPPKVSILAWFIDVHITCVLPYCIWCKPYRKYILTKMWYIQYNDVEKKTFIMKLRTTYYKCVYVLTNYKEKVLNYYLGLWFSRLHWCPICHGMSLCSDIWTTLVLNAISCHDRCREGTVAVDPGETDCPTKPVASPSER